MLNFFKSLLPYQFKRQIKEHLGVPSLHWSLKNLKKKGFSPVCVLDIGAYEGEWTVDFLEVFPEARILMVEAQISKSPSLTKITNVHKNVAFQITLLSSKDGEEMLFHENETASHIINQTLETNLATKIIVTKTVDTIVKDNNFPYPQFMKLDVQGHELEVLKGAHISLTNATICLLEVSLLDLGTGIPLAKEMIDFMAAYDFQMYDITQLMRRPYDKALFQIDLMFIKKDAPFIGEKRWN